MKNNEIKIDMGKMTSEIFDKIIQLSNEFIQDDSKYLRLELKKENATIAKMLFEIISLNFYIYYNNFLNKLNEGEKQELLTSFMRNYEKYCLDNFGFEEEDFLKICSLLNYRFKEYSESNNIRETSKIVIKNIIEEDKDDPEKEVVIGKYYSYVLENISKGIMENIE
ncbi:MAG: hypothetical protein ACLFMO_06795 [Eubacteriales bacterium]